MNGIFHFIFDVLLIFKCFYSVIFIVELFIIVTTGMFSAFALFKFIQVSLRFFEGTSKSS